MRLRIRSSNLAHLLKLALVVGCAGCDATALKSETSGSLSTPDSSSNSKTASMQSTITGNSGTNLLSDNQAAEVASDRELKESTPAVAETKASKSTKTKTEVAKKQSDPVLKKPIANPSPEQLASWAWPEVEPLELLAFNNAKEIGLITCTAHTADDHYILGGFKVAIWKLGAKEPEHVFLKPDDSNNDLVVRCLVLSPDEKWFGVGDSEGSVKLWNLTDRKAIVSKKVFSTGIVDLAVSPDGSTLAAVSYGNVVSLLDSATLETKSKIQLNTKFIRKLHYLSPEFLIAIGDRAEVWNLTADKSQKILDGNRYNETFAALKEPGKFLLGDEKSLRKLDIQDWSISPWLEGNFANNEMLSISPDGKLLVTANGNSLRVWDIDSKRCVQFIDAVGAAMVGLEWLPKSNLLLVPSEVAPLRFWGTKTIGEAIGLKPVHSPVALPAANSEVPAYPIQAAQLIDFRTFPMLPEMKASILQAHLLSGEASVTLDDAKLFYRYQLGRRGWMELDDGSAGPMGIQFRKDGFRLNTGFYDAGGGKIYVNANFDSNIALDKLPRIDSALTEGAYATAGNLMYDAKEDIIDIEAELLRKLTSAGWTAFSKLHTSFNESPNERSLNFVRNGIELLVSARKFDPKPDRFTIQHAASPSPNALPVPVDSKYVEFDGSTAPYLVAISRSNISETVAFYEAELAKQGWLAMPEDRFLDDKQAWLRFLQGQKEVGIGIVKLKDGRTMIRVGNDLSRDSWQWTVLFPPEQKDDEKSKVSAGLEAADFPIPDGAGEVKHDSIDKSITFKVASTELGDLASKLSAAMEKLGWTAEKGGIRSEEYTFFNFEKGDEEIAFRATARTGNAEVNIQGDGLLWNKDLAGGKPIVSFETWMRTNGVTADLELLDRYVAEMKALSKK
jgi:WD40 repeat protein